MPEQRPTDTGRHYLEVLHAITREVVQAPTPEERLTRLVQFIATELRWDVCSLYTLDPDRQELVLKATYGLSEGSVGNVRIPIAEGLVGAAAREEQAIFLARASEDPRYKYLPETGEERYTSLAAVPLRHRGHVNGVLTVQTAAPYEFTTADQHFLEIIAAQISQTVDLALALQPSEGEVRPDVFIGRGVSPGNAAARVHLFAVSPDHIVVAARGFRGADFERDLFARSLAAALGELNDLRKQVENRSPAAAKIFVAQEMILQDVEFNRRVQEMIGQEVSAPRAVATVMDDYIAKFQGMENQILREKAQDLRDLRDQLLAFMMDKKITHFRPEFEEENMVIVAKELTPQQTVRLDTRKIVGIVTAEGGEHSHAAILARTLGLPAVVGVSGILDVLKPEDMVLVDGDDGFVMLNPSRADIARCEERRSRREERKAEMQKAAGLHESESMAGQVELDANIGMSFEVERALKEELKSVGLLRTEFFYMQYARWPDVETQAKFYEPIFRAFGGSPVTVRLLDAGGDKKLASIRTDADQSSLGIRSIRLLLDHPEILESQLAAIHLAAGRTGAVPRILVPMVTHAWELVAVRESLEKVCGKVPYPLGLMIEVPSTLFQIEELADHADFVSIGTNDLAQYLMAADRNIARVTHLTDPLHPAFLRAMAHLFKSLAGLGKRFTVCGEIAGEPVTFAALLAIGYRKFSLSPARAASIQYIIRNLPYRAVSLLHRPLLASSEPEKNERMIRSMLKVYAPLAE